jgi:hypothetical protein
VKTGKIKAPGVGTGGDQRGVANPNWKGGRSSYKAGYRVICFQTWPRECARCGAVEKIAVHHIDGDKQNNRPDNLVPLCSGCHRKVHAAVRPTAEQLWQALLTVWPEGRSKIAEKTGTPGDGQPEVKADEKSQPAATTRD